VAIRRRCLPNVERGRIKKKTEILIFKKLHGHTATAGGGQEYLLLRFHHQPAAGLASLGFRTGIRFATVSRLCPIPNNTVGGHIADLISHTRYVFSHASQRVYR
jgi:hypothetical protein